MIELRQMPDGTIQEITWPDMEISDGGADVDTIARENRILKAQVETLTQVCDFHEELIVELAQEVYA